MDLLIGLDVGTTATKALLLDVEGNTIASATHSYGLITPREDWVEQNPEDLWQGVVITIRKVLESARSQDRVIAISVSSQGGTTIPMNSGLHPLGNAISWMDHRAHEQANRIRQTIGEDKIYKVSGWQLYDGLPLLHILWLREKHPEIFSSTRYFLFVNDFVLYKLTGHLCMDPSNACITQLYNIAKRQWDEDMLELAGIKPKQLSRVDDSGASVGKLTTEASRETGLPKSVLAVNGAHDQYCASLGSGVLKPGDVMLSCGTAWVILAVMDHLWYDPEKRLSISPHAIAGKWGALKSMGAVGASMEWFLDNLWTQKESRSELYDEINRVAESVPAGSKGLIFFPSSGGYGHGARGGFIGLSITHSRNDMARAVMEGIAFDLRWTLDDIREAGIESRQLRMVGGASSSNVWTQIVADITHLPVVLPSASQAASYGAAILAGVGSGVFPDMKSGYRIMRGNEVLIEPKSENSDKYDELFGIYMNTSQHMKDSLSKLSGFRSD